MSYRLLDKKVIFEGKKVRLEIHELENDAKRHLRKEICVHPGAVVILPLLGDGTIALIRNRRYAVGQTLIELPAGTLEAGEEPIVCAARELLEETGYRAGRVEPLMRFFTSPGILSETMHAFVAYDLVKEHTALEEGEEIELLVTPASQALAMIRDGQITDAKTIATLLYFDRFGKVGREVWPA